MEGSNEGQSSKPLSDLRAESVRGIGVTPKDAKKQLEKLGYSETTWDTIIEQEKRGGSSHFVRALIHIARGSEPRGLEDVYRELYPDEPYKSPFPKEKLKFETPYKEESQEKFPPKDSK